MLVNGMSVNSSVRPSEPISLPNARWILQLAHSLNHARNSTLMFFLYTSHIYRQTKISRFHLLYLNSLTGDPSLWTKRKCFKYVFRLSMCCSVGPSLFSLPIAIFPPHKIEGNIYSLKGFFQLHCLWVKRKCKVSRFVFELKGNAR